MKSLNGIITIGKQSVGETYLRFSQISWLYCDVKYFRIKLKELKLFLYWKCFKRSSFHNKFLNKRSELEYLILESSSSTSTSISILFNSTPTLLSIYSYSLKTPLVFTSTLLHLHWTLNFTPTPLYFSQIFEIPPPLHGGGVEFRYSNLNVIIMWQKFAH